MIAKAFVIVAIAALGSGCPDNSAESEEPEEGCGEDLAPSSKMVTVPSGGTETITVEGAYDDPVFEPSPEVMVTSTKTSDNPINYSVQISCVNPGTTGTIKASLSGTPGDGPGCFEIIQVTCEGSNGDGDGDGDGDHTDATDDCEGSNSGEGMPCSNGQTDIVSATTSCAGGMYEIRLKTQAPATPGPVTVTERRGCSFLDAVPASNYVQMQCLAFAGQDFNQSATVHTPNSDPYELGEGEGCTIENGDWVFRMNSANVEFTPTVGGCAFESGSGGSRETDFLNGMAFPACE